MINKTSARASPPFGQCEIIPHGRDEDVCTLCAETLGMNPQFLDRNSNTLTMSPICCSGYKGIVSIKSNITDW